MGLEKGKKVDIRALKTPEGGSRRDGGVRKAKAATKDRRGGPKPAKIPSLP